MSGRTPYAPPRTKLSHIGVIQLFEFTFDPFSAFRSQPSQPELGEFYPLCCASYTRAEVRQRGRHRHGAGDEAEHAVTTVVAEHEGDDEVVEDGAKPAPRIGETDDLGAAGVG